MTRISLHGINSESGFVLLRNMLALFIVAVCFAMAVASLSYAARQGSRFLENTLKEINGRNEFFLNRIER